LLSEIYQGQVTNWNAQQIASANPGVTLPNLPIVTLHRSDSSGDTFLFTSYLSKADASGWGTKIGYNTTVPWPAAPGALGETGNSGMVSGCKATPGCLAYIGISYLTQTLQAGLGYGQLQNGKGQYVLPTSANIAAEAAGFIKKTPANGTISLIYGNINNGYPIVNYEYAIVQAHQSSSSTAKNIRSVLEWAINKNYGSDTSYLSQVDFQALPTKVFAQSVKQILNIK
jgi:phosphate transport system substrate-binding protein